jgi:antitoxin PrlF
MPISRITAKGQTTIPVSIRKAAHINAGDTLAFEIKGDYLIVRKIKSPNDAYLKGVEATLNEWSSPEDKEAWSGLHVYRNQIKRRSKVP